MSDSDIYDITTDRVIIVPDKRPKEKRLIQSVLGKRPDSISHTLARDGDILITGIDPGPVNCGICLFNVTQKRVVACKALRFRETNEDVSVEELIESVRQYVTRDPDGYFRRSKNVYVEQQRDNLPNLSIQYTIQALVGYPKCSFVQSNAVKCKFAEHFPETTWEENKKYAVKSGIKTMSPEELAIMPRKGKRKKSFDHNCFDAVWIARYACERSHNVDLGLSTRKRKQKVTKADKKAKKKKSSKKNKRDRDEESDFELEEDELEQPKKKKKKRTR